MKPRSAIVLIWNNKIALIERHRSGRHYYVFPGGKVESGETPAAAASREAKEELGVEVSIERMVAEIWYQGTPQYYYLATQTAGRFGDGSGHEMDSPANSEKGSYHPIWLTIDELQSYSVLPKIMADLVAKSIRESWPEKPLTVKNRPPD